MSDFLDQLLARNLAEPDSLAVVQPRPVARFETVDGAALISEPPESPTPESAPSAARFDRWKAQNHLPDSPAPTRLPRFAGDYESTPAQN